MRRRWYEKPGQRYRKSAIALYSAAIFRAMVSTMLPLKSV
jgi:hypothetical protein